MALRLLPYLVIVNSAAINNGVHIPFQISVFIFFGYILSSGIAKYGKFYTALHNGCTNLQSHQQRTTVSLLLTALPMLVIFRLFNDSHFERCKMISHCGFDLHFSDD